MRRAGHDKVMWGRDRLFSGAGPDVGGMLVKSVRRRVFVPGRVGSAAAVDGAGAVDALVTRARAVSEMTETHFYIKALFSLIHLFLF